MRESKGNEKTYNFVAKQLLASLFVTILLQIQDGYANIANSIPNISHNPFVLLAGKTVVLFAKHQTLTGHIIKYASRVRTESTVVC